MGSLDSINISCFSKELVITDLIYSNPCIIPNYAQQIILCIFYFFQSYVTVFVIISEYPISLYIYISIYMLCVCVCIYMYLKEKYFLQLLLHQQMIHCTFMSFLTKVQINKVALQLAVHLFRMQSWSQMALVLALNLCTVGQFSIYFWLRRVFVAACGQGQSLVVMCGLLIAMTSFVDHKLQVHGLSSCGLWALEHELSSLVHRLSCFKA